MVREERLELSRVAPLEPKSSASTSFATLAFPIEETAPLWLDLKSLQGRFLDYQETNKLVKS